MKDLPDKIPNREHDNKTGSRDMTTEIKHRCLKWIGHLDYFECLKNGSPKCLSNGGHQEQREQSQLKISWWRTGVAELSGMGRGTTGCNRWRNVIDALCPTAGKEGKYVISPLTLTGMEASFFC